MCTEVGKVFARWYSRPSVAKARRFPLDEMVRFLCILPVAGGGARGAGAAEGSGG